MRGEIWKNFFDIDKILNRSIVYEVIECVIYSLCYNIIGLCIV